MLERLYAIIGMWQVASSNGGTDFFGISFTAWMFAVVPTLIGLGSAYYFYRKSRATQEPCWTMRTANLVKDTVAQYQGLTVAYNGTVVRSLSVSKLTIWNQGAVTIDEKDLETENPLRLEAVNDVRLLEISLLVKNGAAKEVSLDILETMDSAVFRFSYLAKNQGATFQIVHTGTSSADLRVLGETRRGITPVRRTFLAGPPKLEQQLRRVAKYQRRLIRSWFVASICGSFGIIAVSVTNMVREDRVDWDSIIVFGYGLLILSMSILGLSTFRRVEPRGLVVDDDISGG